ncbi:MAG: SCO family protein [Myxococcota bacterium]
MFLWAWLACGGGAAPVDTPPDLVGVVLYAGDHTVLVEPDGAPGVRRLEAGTERPTPGATHAFWLEGDHVQRSAERGAGTVPEGWSAEGLPVRGTVMERSESRVVLDHSAIPTVMDAMVMGFTVAPHEAAPLMPGDTVEARIVRSRYGWQLVEPVKTGTADVWTDAGVPALLVGDTLESVTLEGPDGPVTVGAGQGEPTLLTFVYTRCPDPSFCPAIAARLAALESQLVGGRILTVTLDPDHDTLPVLARWSKSVGAGERWVTARLTGDALRALALRSGQHVTVQGARISHLHRVLVLDAEGVLIERYDDDAWPADRVVRQLATGQPRAREGTVGTESP